MFYLEGTKGVPGVMKTVGSFNKQQEGPCRFDRCLKPLPRPLTLLASVRRRKRTSAAFRSAPPLRRAAAATRDDALRAVPRIPCQFRSTNRDASRPGRLRGARERARAGEEAAIHARERRARRRAPASPDRRRLFAMSWRRTPSGFSWRGVVKNSPPPGTKAKSSAM